VGSREEERRALAIAARLLPRRRQLGPFVFILILLSAISCAAPDTAEVDNLRRDVDEADSRLDSLEESNVELRRQLQRAGTQSQLLELELDSLTRRVTRLCDDFKALREHVDEIEDKVDELVIVLLENGIEAGRIIGPEIYSYQGCE
jgi:septal ring factor EnvC (AmiA/AmiB activator)